MACLTRITRRGNRSKIVAQGRIGVGSFGPQRVRIEFGHACDDQDRRYEHIVTLDHSELRRLLGACRVSDLIARVTSEEFQTWMKLSEKVLKATCSGQVSGLDKST